MLGHNPIHHRSDAIMNDQPDLQQNYRGRFSIVPWGFGRNPAVIVVDFHSGPIPSQARRFYAPAVVEAVNATVDAPAQGRAPKGASRSSIRAFSIMRAAADGGLFVRRCRRCAAWSKARQLAQIVPELPPGPERMSLVDQAICQCLLRDESGRDAHRARQRYACDHRLFDERLRNAQPPWMPMQYWLSADRPARMCRRPANEGPHQAQSVRYQRKVWRCRRVAGGPWPACQRRNRVEARLARRLLAELAGRAGAERIREGRGDPWQIGNFSGWPPPILGYVLLGAGAANALDWPTRAVTIVVPLAGRRQHRHAGAHRRAAIVGEIRPNPLIVENRVSAGGAIGAAQVAARAPGRLYDPCFRHPRPLLLTPLVQKVNFDADKQACADHQCRHRHPRFIAIRRDLPVKTLRNSSLSPNTITCRCATIC